MRRGAQLYTCSPGAAQKGAAAVEFALSLPFLLLLLGGVVTYTGALTAKALLLDVAGSAARGCVMQAQTRAAAQTCGRTAAAALLQVHTQICMGTAQPSFVATVAPTSQIPSTPGGPTISFLTVSLSCPWTFMPFMEATSALAVAQPMTLHASVAMPFLSVN